MQIEITIQAGEGGCDARLLTADQAAIYEAYAMANKLKFVRVSESGS